MSKSFLGALSVFVFLFTHSVFAGHPFCRIIAGTYPGAKQHRLNQLMYGGPSVTILYLEDELRQMKREGLKTYKTDCDVLWHDDEEELALRGRSNPAMEPAEVNEFISNKLKEAEFFKRNLPPQVHAKYFPRSEDLQNVLDRLRIDVRTLRTRTQKKQALTRIFDELRKEYPNGFFGKPVAGFNSEGRLLTAKLDAAAVWEYWLDHVKGPFEQKVRQFGNETEAHNEFIAKNVKYYYEGRTLNDLLEGRQIQVQEKIPAARYLIVETKDGFRSVPEEYRVHVVQGRVLKGATANRWEDVRQYSDARVRQIEEQVQELVDHFPDRLRRHLTFAGDFLCTENGIQMVESNPLGSGYLYPELSLKDSNLLAERFTGIKPPSEAAFQRFRDAEGITAKERAFERFMGLDEIEALIADDKIGPISEYVLEAKSILVRELRQETDISRVQGVLEFMAKYRVHEFLSERDVEVLAGRLDRAGVSPTRISRMLGMSSNEFLYYSMNGKLKPVTGLAYDNGVVTRKLAEWVKTDLGGSRGAEALRLSESAVRDAAEGMLRERVIFSEELRENPLLIERIAKSESEVLELGRGFFYRGKSETLIKAILRLLMR